MTTSRLSFAPAVQIVLQSDTPEGRLARAWVRYAQSLMGEGDVRMEDVIAENVRCIELEAAGFPPGLTGLRIFRQQINEAFPDERAFVADMRFVGRDVVETELHARGTHRGDLMGRKATGRTVFFVIRTLNRFDGDRLIERWDRTDFEGLLRDLDSAQ